MAGQAVMSPGRPRVTVFTEINRLNRETSGGIPLHLPYRVVRVPRRPEGPPWTQGESGRTEVLGSRAWRSPGKASFSAPAPP